MSLRAILVELAIGAVLCGSCSGLAQSTSFSLKRGTYVQKGTDCKDPPFASMMLWDGVGFSGAHSSKCTTHVLSHRGNHFEVGTTCSALGDGSPEPAGATDVTTLSLTRLSNTSFVLDGGDKGTSSYRWCSVR